MTEEELMLTSILDCRRVDLYADPKPLTENQQSLFNEMQLRRKRGEPLQYILEECEFMGLTLKVNKHVLIPRPETEILVELAIEELKKLKRPHFSILDLGTGSGNVSISLARFVGRVDVTTVDVSKEALDIARQNARENFVDHKITFIHSDMTSYLKEQIDYGNRFDMIVSNPPYVKTSDIQQLPVDVQMEPLLALDGGLDGLKFMRNIIEAGRDLLKEDAALMMEIADDQTQVLQSIFDERTRFDSVEFKKDYTNTNRVVIAK